MPFSRVLYALGIPGVGYVNAESLAEHFGTMDALLKAQPEQIEEADGIGPVLAEQVYEELHEERAEELIERLRKAGLRMELDASERRRQGGPLEGKTLVLTGTLPEPLARAGDEADQARRGQGRQLGLQEDRLRRRRRQPGLEAGQGRGAGHRGARRARAAEARPVTKLSALQSGYIQRPMPGKSPGTLIGDAISRARSRPPLRGGPARDRVGGAWSVPALAAADSSVVQVKDGKLRVDGVPGSPSMLEVRYRTAAEAGFGGVSDRFLVKDTGGAQALGTDCAAIDPINDLVCRDARWSRSPPP